MTKDKQRTTNIIEKRSGSTNLFVKISLILVLHLRQFFIVGIFVNTVARPVSQQLPTLPQHLISTPVFGGVRAEKMDDVLALRLENKRAIHR
jgi:hypothetical protein